MIYDMKNNFVLIVYFTKLFEYVDIHVEFLARVTWEALFFGALDCPISHTFTCVAVISLVENISSSIILSFINTVCKKVKKIQIFNLAQAL